jgi:hypothetical protein
MTSRRTLVVAGIALAALATAPLAAHAQSDTEVGGTVPSYLGLALDQTGPLAVTARVTSTDGTVSLSVGDAAVTDTVFNTPLKSWTEAIAAAPVAITLPAGSPTVLITLATAP